MTGRKAAVMLMAVAALLVISREAVFAQELGEQLSRAELDRLIAHADEPADYQKLATFFHAQEDLYRAKAQAAMDDYSSCVRRFLIAPKFPTRADQDFRLFDYYSAKADRQAELAAWYDDLLLTRGIKPRPKVRAVSTQDLQNSPLARDANAALPR